MAAQTSDCVIYRQKKLDLVGLKGAGLFDPNDYDLKLKARDEACWRGYTVEYAVKDGRLMVNSIWVNPLKIGELPLLLFGAPLDLASSCYTCCPDPVPFTGSILVAQCFRPEFAEEMGFHQPWKYNEVHELFFSESGLVREVDRSDKMELVQAEDFRQRKSCAESENSHDWIQSRYDLSYPDLDLL